MKQKYTTFVGLILTCCLASAAELATWDVAGIDLNDTTQGHSAPFTIVGTTSDSGIDVAALSLGAGVNSTTSNNQYGFKITNSNSQTTLAGALANDHYLQFSISAATGYTLNLTNLEFKGQASSTGATGVAILSDIAGFTDTSAIATISTGANATGGFDTDSSGFGSAIDLSDASYQNIASATFRIYGWGSTSSSGATYIRSLSGNDLVINGTVVPEPSTYALLAGLLGLTFVMLQRRQA